MGFGISNALVRLQCDQARLSGSLRQAPAARLQSVSCKATIWQVFCCVFSTCYDGCRPDKPVIQTSMMIDQVQTTRLANGLTILTEHMPGLRSVSLGIWVRRGSRHETPALNGICHFIEHALFKGSQRRSARQIATESDRLGGHLDAY